MIFLRAFFFFFLVFEDCRKALFRSSWNKKKQSDDTITAK